MKSAKSQFYKNKVADLKLANPGQWYQCLKKITSHDQHKSEQLNVDQINHLSDQEQAEKMQVLFLQLKMRMTLFNQKTLQSQSLKKVKSLSFTQPRFGLY